MKEYRGTLHSFRRAFIGIEEKGKQLGMVECLDSDLHVSGNKPSLKSNTNEELKLQASLILLSHV